MIPNSNLFHFFGESVIYLDSSHGMLRHIRNQRAEDGTVATELK
jgi:hypothetical protein